ncbi:uncharacterized protein LOC121386848 [Gigantopelta aegis]|uniref:uncharacterized protein LOC121386848 n=1 Tax=Gigantopelta aegis TaxID=1735272 RepID=UPI001B88C005|nr:uncharacterized protein LOC121386848 [Gigantopelta aegis]
MTSLCTNYLFYVFVMILSTFSQSLFATDSTTTMHSDAAVTSTNTSLSPESTTSIESHHKPSSSADFDSNVAPVTEYRMDTFPVNNVAVAAVVMVVGAGTAVGVLSYIFYRNEDSRTRKGNNKGISECAHGRRTWNTAKATCV